MTVKIPPTNVVSTSYITDVQEALKIRQKKQRTDDLTYTSLEYPPFPSGIHPKETTDRVVKESVMDSVLSPYLKAVILIFFNESTTRFHVIQTKKSKLKKLEIKGALLTVYEEMMETGRTSRVRNYFDEEKERYVMDGNPAFSRFCVDRAKESPESEVLVINISHNQLKSYSNLETPEPLLHLLSEIHHTDYHAFQKGREPG